MIVVVIVVVVVAVDLVGLPKAGTIFETNEEDMSVQRRDAPINAELQETGCLQVRD